MNNDGRRFELVKIAFEVMVPHAIESTNARAFYEHKEAATRIVELVDAVLAEMDKGQDVDAMLDAVQPTAEEAKKIVARLRQESRAYNDLLKRVASSSETNMDGVEDYDALLKRLRDSVDTNMMSVVPAPPPATGTLAVLTNLRKELTNLRKEVQDAGDSNRQEYSMSPEPKSQYSQGFLGGFGAAARCAEAYIDGAIRKVKGSEHGGEQDAK